ncbi:MAG: deoxyribonuclease IV [Thaumarchaeota archaeon]|nr:deoxyribonuclease IV [Nitrososphaerota archaeon]MCL5067751.1 deoxyribonuclease IV [Nitrososphaerota archaeon]
MPNSEAILRRIGMHVSISGKLDQSVDRAKEVGCVGTFQIFTCSPRRWAAAELKSNEVDLFKDKVAKGDFLVFAHMPYLPNLSSPEKSYFKKSVDTLTREISRCEKLGVSRLVLHFGSHMGTSIESGHERIIEACKTAIADSKDCKVRLLLENSAGVKNSVGSKFEYVSKVLERIDEEKRTGVCLDTCHAFASGYDLRNQDAVRSTMREFENEIGLERLYLMHLNDSKGEIGCGKDRHEDIGRGYIGREGFRSLLNLEELQNVPMILETPVEKEGDDKKNLQTVKSLIR